MTPLLSEPDERGSVSRGTIPRVVPTLLAAVAFVALVFWGGREAREESTETSLGAVEIDSVSAVRSVLALATFAGQLPDEHGSTSNEYAATGVRHIASAIEALSGPDLALASDVAALRFFADRLVGDTKSTDHTALVREAFVVATSALAEIQRARLEALTSALDVLRHAGTRLAVEDDLREQIAVVHLFFAEASHLLRAMSEIRR